MEREELIKLIMKRIYTRRIYAEELADDILRLFSVSGRLYQIDFGNHLRCKLKITDGKIEVDGVINGWGDNVPLEQVVIIELTDR